MIWLAAIFLCAVFLPTLWVRWVMQRYAREVPNLPGTGGELAKHLIQRFELDSVKAEVSDIGDHYDPQERTVRLSESNWSGRSLTAVAVAAHEVGHAIQHRKKDPRLQARTTLVPLVNVLGQASVGVFGRCTNYWSCDPSSGAPHVDCRDWFVRIDPTNAAASRDSAYGMGRKFWQGITDTKAGRVHFDPARSAGTAGAKSRRTDLLCRSPS